MKKLLIVTLMLICANAQAGLYKLPKTRVYDMLQYSCTHYLHHINMKACIRYYYECMEEVYLRDDFHTNPVGTIETPSQKVMRAYDVCVISEIIE